MISGAIRQACADCYVSARARIVSQGLILSLVLSLILLLISNTTLKANIKSACRPEPERDRQFAES